MISKKIKLLRESCGLSQSALAKQLGVTRTSVNAWEMDISTPTAPYLIALAQFFHTSTDYLLGLNDNEIISLEGMTAQEKKILYDLVQYFSENSAKP